MANLSTLRSCNQEGAQSMRSPWSPGEHEAYLDHVHSPSIPITALYLPPSILSSVQHDANALGTLTSPTFTPSYLGGFFGEPESSQREEPMDGKNFVWYCCGCGDGPYGTWQNVCQTNACQKTKCPRCPVQETK
ncbi:hypothetical protein K504DRAFT_170967 [Pleomassaria siparia CBS 279.74]|uniref:Uncharacterized protein n=1 Tax=Pleomassaria siparia CBS 279.74 TaxID=1314801 RepID=A0A6G1JU28_9PLEO|nr:hypothetical protein K504DRAFT_170967 [Pleomassaria siparia CBS 279.74]